MARIVIIDKMAVMTAPVRLRPMGAWLHLLNDDILKRTQWEADQAKMVGVGAPGGGRCRPACSIEHGNLPRPGIGGVMRRRSRMLARYGVGGVLPAACWRGVGGEIETYAGVKASLLARMGNEISCAATGPAPK